MVERLSSCIVHLFCLSDFDRFWHWRSALMFARKFHFDFVLRVKPSVHESQTEVELVLNIGTYRCPGRKHTNTGWWRDGGDDRDDLELGTLYCHAFSLWWLQHCRVVYMHSNFRTCRSYSTTVNTHVYVQFCCALQICLLRACSNCAPSAAILCVAFSSSEWMTLPRKTGVYLLHPVLPEVARLGRSP